MKHFYDLRTVDDLADGEIATPEPGITYDLRTINNRKLDVGSVVDVIRQGPTLFARTKPAGTRSAILRPRRRHLGTARLVDKPEARNASHQSPHVYTVWAFSR